MEREKIFRIVREKFISEISSLSDNSKAYLEMYDELQDADAEDVSDALNEIGTEVKALLEKPTPSEILLFLDYTTRKDIIVSVQSGKTSVLKVIDWLRDLSE